MTRTSSLFSTLQLLQSDSILGLMSVVAADPAAEKLDLTVGVYRDASGVTPVMQAVACAERALIAEQTSKSYLPPLGVAGFTDGLADFVFGAEREGLRHRTVSIQTPGGCGALRVGGELLKRSNAQPTVLISRPTWGNHRGRLSGVGARLETYAYYDPDRRRFDQDAMLASLQQAAGGSVVLLQVSCHNPTGCDPTPAQWDAILALCAERGLLPFFDLAYQGLGQDPERDSYALRAAARVLPEFLLAVSCSKNMGLYRERTGALFVVCDTPERVAIIESHVRQVAREAYSMPPAHGALIAARIFTDAGLRRVWLEELAAMGARLRELRSGLAAALCAERPELEVGWLTAQRGMFSLLGLEPDVVRSLRERHHVYAVGDSRINVAGLGTDSIPRVARIIAPLLSSREALLR